MSDFIESVILGSFGSAGLLALAGFIFKTRISHWLSKDLEKQKSQYARELEAYKVSLIAETERIKAIQEVKKEAALLNLKQKYAALSLLQSVASGLFIDISSYAALPPTTKSNEDAKALVRRVGDMTTAFTSAFMFLTVEEKRICSNYQNALSEYMPHLAAGKPSFERDEPNPKFEAGVKAHSALEKMIAQKISELSD